MKNTFYLCSIFLLSITSSCKNKEANPAAQPRVNIYVPSGSANVVFHLKDNKVQSFDILGEDGAPLTDQLVYKPVGTGEVETCYRCSGAPGDMSHCTPIPCPVNPDYCKEIYCGPLSFQVNELSKTPDPGKTTQFTIVTGDFKK